MILFTICFGLCFSQLPDNYKWSEPQNLSILNSNEDDFAPSWNKYENILYFNSSITGYSKFYTSEYLNSNFNAPVLLYGELNQPRNNQSYITFESKDYAYISSYRLTEKRSYLNIFQTVSKRKQWMKAYPADNLSFDAFAAQATVSPDGSVMVFSSNINSRDGNTDLWIAYKQDNGTFGAFVKLKELNTPGNEITPFLLSKDTLFFASDGQEGPGGYDLFMSVFANGNWQRPNPLTDFNTKYDESDLTILPTREAIFASNRPGGKGKLDLYISRPEKIESVIQHSDIELSIAAQVTEINVRNEKTYHQAQIIPYIFSDNDFALLNELALNVRKFDYNTVPVSIDSLYKYSLYLIGIKLKKFPDAKLIIMTNSTVTKNVVDNIEKYFFNILGLPADRFIWKNYTGSPYDKPYITFDSDNENILEPIELTQENIKLMPPALDIYLDARPRRMLKNWSFELFLSSANKDKIRTGIELPAQFSLDLKPFSDYISKSDSIVFEMNAIDSLSAPTKSRLLLNVAHTEVKEQNLIKLNQKQYDYYDFLIIDPEHIGANYSFNKFKSQISVYAKDGKKIVIQYQKNNAAAKKTAENFYAVLQINGGINKYQLSYESVNFSDESKLSQKFLPYFIRVLVEIK
jgi:hypothetical protein